MYHTRKICVFINEMHNNFLQFNGKSLYSVNVLIGFYINV